MTKQYDRIPNSKSAKSYKWKRVVLSRKPVYSGISKIRTVSSIFFSYTMYYTFHCLHPHCTFQFSLALLFIVLESRCCPI